MSEATIQTIIRKAVVDAEFRHSLVNNPAEALRDYNLSEDERTGLSALDSNLFDANSSFVEIRLSRGTSFN